MMSTKGIHSIFSHSFPERRDRFKTSHGTVHRRIEENISNAEEIITKWDPDGSADAQITSIFYESRDEAGQFLRAVADLRQAMNSFMAGSAASGDELLIRGQKLMRAAIRRLQKEFYQILSAKRKHIDPEIISVSDRSPRSLNSSSSLSEMEDDEIHGAEFKNEVEQGSLFAMSDLRSIADCMISCGYGMECVKIYKSIRRSIVDESLYKLGFDRLSPSRVQKLDWDVLEIRLRNWLAASKVAFRTLFAGERALCDHVFASSGSMRESSFAEIARDPAIYFLGFPELVAQKAKKSPEKVFRLLDMYDSITELLPEIESVFSNESTSAVRTRAISSLQRLAEAVRSLLCDFEAAIQKDASKVPVPGGGLHPLTRYTMNYLIFLVDYSDALTDIYADQPFEMPASLPEPLFGIMAATSAPSSPTYHAGESSLSSISLRFAWLILVLLCKLDSKAASYREVSLSYLFLANNLRYVVNKVRGSKQNDILGDDWVFKQESKARRYTESYERLAWGKVLAAAAPSLAAVTDAAAAREAMRVFDDVFRDACKEQAAWIVPDGKMRDELKLSVARKLIPAYKNLYQAAAAQLRGEKDLPIVLRFTPDDLANYLSDLFFGDASTGSTTSSISGSSKGSSPTSITPKFETQSIRSKKA